MILMFLSVILTPYLNYCHQSFEEGKQKEAPGCLYINLEEIKPFLANSFLFSCFGYSFRYNEEFTQIIFKVPSGSKV